MNNSAAGDDGRKIRENGRYCLRAIEHPPNERLFLPLSYQQIIKHV